MDRDEPGFQLDYETPAEARHRRTGIWLLFALHKLLFASGLGLLALGIGAVVQGHSEGPSVMGAGAFMAGLAIPLHRRTGK